VIDEELSSATTAALLGDGAAHDVDRFDAKSSRSLVAQPRDATLLVWATVHVINGAGLRTTISAFHAVPMISNMNNRSGIAIFFLFQTKQLELVEGAGVT